MTWVKRVPNKHRSLSRLKGLAVELCAVAATARNVFPNVCQIQMGLTSASTILFFGVLPELR